MILPELQFHFKGAERADSIVTNPHKWLFTPFDLSVLYVKDLDLLKHTFSLVPGISESYRNRNESDGLWNSTRTAFSLAEIMVRDALFRSGRFDFTYPRTYSSWQIFSKIGLKNPKIGKFLRRYRLLLVCFRACPKNVDDLDALNEKIMNEINASGEAYLSHTKLNEKFTIAFVRRQHQSRRKTFEKSLGFAERKM